MPTTLPLLLPLFAAFLYAVAALMLKRATEGGIGPWRISFTSNLIMAAMFAPFWLMGGKPFAFVHLWHAALCGLFFFVGQIFTFLALSRGDVSVATPVLGTKVIFVALFSVLLGAEPLNGSTWLAALLTTLATALLGIGKPHRTHSLAAGLCFGFSAAACFALTDVFCQKWAPLWGFGHFAPAMFAMVTICSFGLIPFFNGSLRVLPWRWVLSGGFFLGLQCIGVAYSIMVFGSATTTNIIYSSRGIWSVILVWSVGHWFANVERSQGTPVMLRRLAGSALLLAAIGLIVHR
ncbi:MAG: hypothetical protein JWL90_2573 [Chthoniobacteraceae bacterium]|nr:hypothetical protein [Chthoniobacteraceae bacterium]